MAGHVIEIDVTPRNFSAEELLALAEPASIAHRVDRLALTPAVLDRLAKSRQRVLDLDGSGGAYYGINTGFGPLCTTRIAPSEMGQLQRNLLLSHAVGVGPAVPDGVVRLMLVSKIAALSRGFSGVDPVIVLRLLDFLNEDLLPMVPAQGSVGASGDLAPLAHLCLPLIGIGKVRLRGRDMDAAKALKTCGLEPLDLGPKDGLALINGTQYIASYGALVLSRALNLARAADIVLAMSIDAMRGSVHPFDARLFQLRPSGDASVVAGNVRTLLANSEIMESHRNCGKVQDPYSMRCAPQVHGTARAALRVAFDTMQGEFVAVTDNPIVMEDGEVISAGNFHGEPLGMQMDFAAIAIAELASISERRSYLLIEGRDELPKLLMRDVGSNSGYMIPQYTAAALVSENKVLCHPATVDTIPTSLGQEDHVSMGSIAARKALTVLENAESVLGIELLTSAQALDYRRPLKSGAGVEAAHAAVRTVITHSEADRYLAPDIAEATRLIRSGELVAAARRGCAIA